MAGIFVTKNSKSGKLIQLVSDFSGGLNTKSAVHEVNANQLVEGINFELDERGAISKRKGWTSLPSLGPNPVQGLYMFKRYNSREMLMVQNGKLYKYVTLDFSLLDTGVWVEVPIRRHAPQAVTVTIATTGAVGPNLVASGVYDYTVVAKDSVGKTLQSSVSRGTQGATPYPITVSWDKVYGCTSYEVYKNGKLVQTVADVSFWVDNGSTPLGPENPPTENTTVVAIPLPNLVDFVNYNDRVLFTTGNGLCIYDGTGASLVTPYKPTTTEQEFVGINALRDITNSIHKCKYLRLHWDRLFISGDPDHPQNYYFSDVVLSPLHPQVYFPGSYAADVTSDNGSPITGMVNFRDSLIIFTTDSTHAVFGMQPDETKSDPFVQRLIHPSVGCLSSRSIAVVDNSVMFVSRQGIYSLSNLIASQTALNVQYLSVNIEPTFRKLGRPDLTTACFHDQQYKVCFPQDGVVLRYYVNGKSWALDTNCQFNHFVIWDTELYASSALNGRMFKHGVKKGTVPGFANEVPTYDDDLDYVPFIIRTKSFDLGAGLNIKKTRKLVLMAKRQSVASSLRVDATLDYITEGKDFVLNDSSVLGDWELGTAQLGDVDVVFPTYKFREKGRMLHLTFSNEMLGEPVTLYGVGVEYKIKRL